MSVLDCLNRLENFGMVRPSKKMNDKQAFEDWISDASNHYADALAYEYERNFCYQAWMAGCEYMRNKCNPLDALSLYEKLELERAENKKLREALKIIKKASCYTEYEDAVSTAKEALKELGE